jgi:hypothetical protein
VTGNLHLFSSPIVQTANEFRDSSDCQASLHLETAAGAVSANSMSVGNGIPVTTSPEATATTASGQVNNGGGNAPLGGSGAFQVGSTAPQQAWSPPPLYTTCDAPYRYFTANCRFFVAACGGDQVGTRLISMGPADPDSTYARRA